MKKIDLNFPLKDLKGNKVEGGTAGELLGLCFSESRSGDKLKFYNWAVKLSMNEVLEIDQSDFETIKNFVKTTEMMAAIAAGQIIEALNKID